MTPLIVVSGPPGAGKSTVARLLAARFEQSALVAGDEFFAFITCGYIDPWLSEAHEQNVAVIRAAAAAAGRLNRGGYTVVYEGVLGPWFVGEFMAEAGVEAIQYVSLMPPEETCLQRVTTRTGHGFNDLEAAAQIYREFDCPPIDGRHVLRDLWTPEQAVDEVLRRLGEGELEWRRPG